MSLEAGGLPRIRWVHAARPSPHLLPQRVVVAGADGPVLTSFLDRVAAALDVPLVRLDELAGPDDAARLAAFDGWVTTAEPAPARTVVLDRADLVVLVLTEEPGTLRSLVRRTVRRMRADATPPPDLTWFDALPVTHPGLASARLVGPALIEEWLGALAG